MSYTTILVSVLLIYLALNLFAGLYTSRKHAKSDVAKSNSFATNYFIGGRSMGGLVLAMTLVATFTSASSFIGGPGLAFSKGLVWVYLSMIQVPTAFIILGILGKKFAVISRKTGAVTVNEYLMARYDSKLVLWISSICLVLFFIAQMMSQFIGGAVLFQTITGLPYIYGLGLFGLVVIIYTSIGGFKAVVTTDTIQGLIMVLGGIIILYTIIKEAGGTTLMIEKLNVANPNWDNITGGGTVTQSFVMSFWVLVGIGVLGLPQTAVRGMGFKDTKALHSAMIYGTVVVGFLMLVMHISGVFAPAVLDGKELTTTDYVVPTLVLKYMHPVVAGLFVAAPLAAVMSTVSSLLIMASATIVKDLYMTYKDEHLAKESADQGEHATKESVNSEKEEHKIAFLSIFTTFLIGGVVFIFTIYPPEIIVWINLFAMGGLECAFFAPILLGLYWKRANATGAIASAVCGVASFLIISNAGFSLGGTTAIVPSIAASVIAFILGTYLGKPTRKEVLRKFF
ncbi:sodium/pantothenate symporter [Eubacteriales bacterium KG127]